MGFGARICLIMFTNYVAQAAFAVCAPMVPLEFERKGIQGSYVGLVFALYSVGYIIWPPVVSKYGDRMGRTTMLALALVVMGTAFVCFGLIAIMVNKVHILTLASVLRLIHGMCCSTIFTTGCFLCSNEYPDKEERDKMCGYLTAFGGTGLITGPLIGSVLFDYFGFKLCFFIYGSTIVLIGIVFRLAVPAKTSTT